MRKPVVLLAFFPTAVSTDGSSVAKQARGGTGVNRLKIEKRLRNAE
jgi:hypothetical protein